MAVTRSELWKAYAEVYHQLRLLDPYRQLLAAIVDLAAPADNHTVLDAACGDGALLMELRRRGLRPHVIGLDNSPEMLGRAAAEPYDGQRELHQADLNQPHAAWHMTGLADRIICNNGLYALANPAATLREMAAVAKPDAWLVASTPRPNPDPQAVLRQHLAGAAAGSQDQRYNLAWLQAQLRLVAEYNQRITQEFPGVFHFPDEAELRHWFNEAGWEIIHLSTIYGEPPQNWLIMARRRRE